MKHKNILIIGSLFLIFFLLGAEFHYKDIFPYGSGIRNKLEFLKKSKKENNEICANLKYRKREFEFFLTKVKSGGSIDHLIIGDSVADGAHSPKLFDLKYDIIATDAATVGCLVYFIDYVKDINPKNLIIYLGGNDADGQGIQNFNEASETYLEFIKNFKNKNENSKVYALGVNIGVPWRRDNNFVINFNELVKNGINELNSSDIKYIESFNGLNFEKSTREEISKSNLSDNGLTYDGEHLKYQGYVEWFNYIDKKIENGIYKK